MKRLIRCADVKLQVSPCTPDQGHESTFWRSVRQELVEDTDYVFAVDFVSITLLPIAVEQSLGIGDTNRALSATGHRQLWICGNEVGLIQQKSDLRVSWYFEQ